MVKVARRQRVGLAEFGLALILWSGNTLAVAPEAAVFAVVAGMVCWLARA